MSLRTSDRRHWCGSPPVKWKQLGFAAKVFENLGDCARRKYPWGTTPACALVRNDKVFSNSSRFFMSMAAVAVFAGFAVPAAAAFALPFALAQGEEKANRHGNQDQYALQVHILTPLRRPARCSAPKRPLPRQWRTGRPPSAPQPGRCPFPASPWQWLPRRGYTAG